MVCAVCFAVFLYPTDQGWGEYQIYESEHKYEYLIFTWVRVRVQVQVRVLVDEYEYKYEYWPMIYILYKQQYCIFQPLKGNTVIIINLGQSSNCPSSM